MSKEETQLPTNLDGTLRVFESAVDRADDGVVEMEDFFRALIDRTRDAEEEMARLKRELERANGAGGRLLDKNLMLAAENDELREKVKARGKEIHRLSEKLARRRNEAKELRQELTAARFSGQVLGTLTKSSGSGRPSEKPRIFRAEATEGQTWRVQRRITADGWDYVAVVEIVNIDDDTRLAIAEGPVAFRSDGAVPPRVHAAECLAIDIAGRLNEAEAEMQRLKDENAKLRHERLAKLRGPGPREDTTPGETSDARRASTVFTLTDAPCPAVLDHVACLDCGGHFAENPAAPFRCCPKCGRKWRGEWLTLDLAKDTLTPYRCFVCSAVVFHLGKTSFEYCPRCGRRNLLHPDSETEEPENTIVTPLQMYEVPFAPVCPTCDDTDGYDWECEKCGDRIREAFLERDRTGRPCMCPECVVPAKPLEPRPRTGDGHETARIRLVPSSFKGASVLELLCEACGRSFPWVESVNLDDRHPLTEPPADAPVFCPSCGRMIQRKGEK